MKRASKILALGLLLTAATFAAQEAVESGLPRKACRFLTYVTTVETADAKTSLLEHLMIGFYYANETCASRPMPVS